LLRNENGPAGLARCKNFFFARACCIQASVFSAAPTALLSTTESAESSRPNRKNANRSRIKFTQVHSSLLFLGCRNKHLVQASILRASANPHIFRRTRWLVSTKNTLLGQLSIPTPCSADWNDLVGDGRRRYCEQCDRNVYDFSKMTATEVGALLATLQGRVCARITWRKDGSLLTEDPLPRLPVARRRAAPFASVAVTTLITITASPAGRPPAQAPSIVQANPALATPIIRQQPHPAGETSSIAGTVFDRNQAVIVGARVSLINQASGDTLINNSSYAGEFIFPGLTKGRLLCGLSLPDSRRPSRRA